MATKFPPPAPPFIRARNQGGRQTPKAIVLHGTVSSDNAGTARNIAGWWNGPTSPMSSAHYVVDPKEVIQCVGDHSVAYHCGFNQDSIGVEFCDEQQGPVSRWDDRDSNAILARAARLVAELSLAYGIEVKRPSTAALRRKGPHGIYGHNDSRLAFGRTTHTDPRDFPWAKFLRMVRREVENIKAEVAPKPEPKPKPGKHKADKNEPQEWVEFVLTSINLGKGTFQEKVDDLNSLVLAGAHAIGVQEAGDRELEINQFLVENPTWGRFMVRGPAGGKVPVLYDTAVLELNPNNSSVAVTNVADKGWVGEGAGPDYIQDKGLTHAAFIHKPSGRRLHILNHHLVASHRRAGLPTKAKKARQRVAAQQAEAFMKERQGSAGMVFGTGDWNSGRRWVQAVTEDMLIDSNSGPTHQNSEIDYVSHFPSVNVKVASSALIETSGSRKYKDHRAVLVRYLIEVR